MHSEEKGSGFIRVEAKSLDGSQRVMFEKGNFRIHADKTGVHLEGDRLELTDRQGLDEFAKTLSLAWTEYQRMLKKIRKNLTLNSAGH